MIPNFRTVVDEVVVSGQVVTTVVPLSVFSNCECRCFLHYSVCGCSTVGGLKGAISFIIIIIIIIIIMCLFYSGGPEVSIYGGLPVGAGELRLAQTHQSSAGRGRLHR